MNTLSQGYKWFLNGVVMLLFLFGYSQNNTTAIHKNIQQHSDSIYNSLVEVRRDLHKHPEVSGEEKRTAAIVEQYLKDLGLEVKTGVGGYGVIGILQGDKPGKKVAWRADMDAMPSKHTEDLEYRSVIEGKRHICGHDVHTTIALGIANVLAKQKQDLEGTVYFIFQPSEENYKGVKTMLADGIFDIIQPDEIYAAHLSPMPAGLVATKPHYLFADYKQINVQFKTKHQDSALVAFTKNAIKKLQNVAADSKFWDTRNLMDPQIGIGSKNTIFKNYITVDKQFKVSHEDGILTITGYVSADDSAVINKLPVQVEQTIKNSKYSKLLIEVNYDSDMISYSPDRGNIDNDPALSANAIAAITSIYGQGSALELTGVIPDGRGDDFSYFQREVPGVYFLIGGSNFEKGIIAMPHTPNFTVDESCIKTGVNYFSSLLAQRLSN